MAEFVKVASTNEIAPGQGRLVTVKGRDIALFNVDGKFFALSNACTHDEGSIQGVAVHVSHSNLPPELHDAIAREIEDVGDVGRISQH